MNGGANGATKTHKLTLVMSIGGVILLALVYLSIPSSTPNEQSEIASQESEPLHDAKKGSPSSSETSAQKAITSENVIEGEFLDGLPTGPPGLHSLAQGFTYIKIEAANLRHLLQKANIKNPELVTKKQLDSLLLDLEKTIWAYKTGDGQLLLDAVLISSYEINNDRLKWYKYHPFTLQYWTPPPGVEIPTEPDQIMRRSVREIYGDSDGYVPLFDALAADNTVIEFHETDALPLTLQERFTELGSPASGTGFAFVQPSVRFVNSPQAVLKKHRRLQYSDVFMGVADGDGKKSARLKRYYWSSEDDCWLPMEVGHTFGFPLEDSTRSEFF